MCGIAGELRRGAAPDREALERMSAALAPRGPDGAGTWFHDGSGLAHRRLAIIDLSERGAQPMVDDGAGADRRLQRLHLQPPRAARRARGRGPRVLRSTSDTEVLLKGWATWGEGMLDRLAGMFAFCLVEHDSGRCVLARDRLGIKPLYLQTRPRAACASPRRCPRCWPAAASTRASTRSRCTTTSPSTRSSRRRGRSCAACRKLPPRHAAGGGARRHAAASAATGTRPSSATRSARTGRRPSGRRRDHGGAARGGAPAHGGRRARRDPALGRASTRA